MQMRSCQYLRQLAKKAAYYVTVIGFLPLIFFECSVTAKPLIESFGRVEADWTAMKIRFFGLDASEPNHKKSLQTRESDALSEGLMYVQNTFKALYEDYNGTKNNIPLTSAKISSEQLVQVLTRTTYVVSSDLYAKGSLRLDLESGLAKAFTSPDLNWKKTAQENPQTTEAANTSKPANSYSSILLKIDKPTAPYAIYSLVDAGGKSLYTVEQVKRDAFEHHLMGRWLVDPKPNEIKRYGGKNVATLKAKLVSHGVLEVDGLEFSKISQENQNLLATSSFLLSVPESI